MELGPRMAVSLAFGCLLAATPAARAADGDLDPRFDYDGVAQPGAGLRPQVAVQADGRIVVAGNVGDSLVRICRLTPTGGLDRGFDDDGCVLVAGDGRLRIAGVAAQPDGKIVAAYTEARLDGDRQVIVQRFLPDGEPDLDFGNAGANGSAVFRYGDGLRSSASALALAPDGGIVIAGDADGDAPGGPDDDFAAARLTADGRLDPGFSDDGRVTHDLGGSVEYARSMTLEGDRIVLAGATNRAAAADPATQAVLLRLTSNGDVDTAFGGNGDGSVGAPGPASLASDVITTYDGGLLAVGSGPVDGGSGIWATKLTADGGPDPAAPGAVEVGARSDNGAASTSRTVDGKYLVAGWTSTGDGRRLLLEKLRPDLVADASFGPNGQRVYDDIGPFDTSDVALDRDGDLLAAGDDGADTILARVSDSIPAVSVHGGSALEGGAVPFAITLTKTSGFPVGVDFGTGQGSADRHDFTGRHGTVTIPPGATTAAVDVQTLADRVLELDEQFRLEIGNPVNARIVGSQSNGTILNRLVPGHCANAIDGGPGGDPLTGSALGDRMRGRDGADRLLGLSGPDCLSGNRGDDELRGGAGDDRLDGGPGADRLRGGGGNDTIVGGRGRNRYWGGDGNDRINARNGRSEVVDCGRGRDRVKADRDDRLRRCERVAFG